MTPGSFNITAQVRGLLADAITKSGKSREDVAAQMSEMTGKRITARMLNDWTSLSHELHRFPLSFGPAFCRVVDDCRIVEAMARAVDRVLITQEDAELLEVGRQYLAQKRAAERMAALEARIKERGR